jgi:hypothetical protein
MISPPVATIAVLKDIDLLSGVGCTNGITSTPLTCGTTGAVYDSANITTIVQALSQVPEPSFYGLLAIALIGLFVTIRREKRLKKQEN